MRIWLVALLAAFVLAGCGSPDRPWRSRGDRVLGLGSEDAEDPVSGTVILKEDSVKREYRGTTYYFESTETAEIFDRNPGFFAIPENPPLDAR
jgi:YHS domain-containing protein